MSAYNADEIDEEKTRQRRWRAQDIEDRREGRITPPRPSPQGEGEGEIERNRKSPTPLRRGGDFGRGQGLRMDAQCIDAIILLPRSRRPRLWADRWSHRCWCCRSDLLAGQLDRIAVLAVAQRTSQRRQLGKLS